MSKQDKKLVESIANAIRILPANKREYLLGVANGMAVMAAAADQSRSGERREGT